MESGIFLPNLSFNEPCESVEALLQGRIKIINEPTPWEGGLVGINSFGFGGSNCHILLKSNEKEKINQGLPLDCLPRLVVVSGRTGEAVEILLNDVR